MMKHGFMGAAMAAMMLWMLHDPIMSGGMTLSLGAVGFVLGQYASSANQELIAGWGLHWGVVAAMIAVIFAYILLSRHILGLNIRLAGEAPRAARFAGVNPERLVLLCLGVSGGLAGLAGLFEVAGPAGQISIDFNVGYGFTAIIVAFLGRLHPIGILLAGLLMAVNP